MWGLVRPRGSGDSSHGTRGRGAEGGEEGDVIIPLSVAAARNSYVIAQSIEGMSDEEVEAGELWPVSAGA